MTKKTINATIWGNSSGSAGQKAKSYKQEKPSSHTVNSVNSK